MLKILKKIIFLIFIIFIAFISCVGILWCADGLDWYEYQSDYYKIGTVIDKTVLSSHYSSIIYITVKYDDGSVFTYDEVNRSDYPNSYILKTIAEKESYEFRIGKFIHKHYGRKKDEKAENIISATLIGNEM